MFKGCCLSLVKKEVFACDEHVFSPFNSVRAGHFLVLFDREGVRSVPHRNSANIKVFTWRVDIRCEKVSFDVRIMR